MAATTMVASRLAGYPVLQYGPGRRQRHHRDWPA